MSTPLIRALEISHRALHLKIHPAPRTLADRQQIHSLLQRFGPTDYFLSLAYHPTRVTNAFWTIMSTAEAAQKALDASPIRFTISSSSPPSPSSSSSFDNGDDNNNNANSNSAHTQQQQEQQEQYELRISPSDNNFIEGVRQGALYEGFTPVPYGRSAIAADLAERIPEGIAKGGLCDWVTDGIGSGGSRGGEGGMPARIREVVREKRRGVQREVLGCLRKV